MFSLPAFRQSNQSRLSFGTKLKNEKVCVITGFFALDDMKYILINENYRKRYSHELEAHGFDVVPLPADSGLNRIVAAHADTIIFGDGQIINDNYLKKLPPILWRYFNPSKDRPHGDYPDDTVFNALKVGRHIFCGKAVSGDIMSYANENGLTVIPVKQGYAHCTTLAIDEKNAAITADRGMAAAMERVGVNVLLISEGHILLEGAEYGFIGGASFVDRDSRRVFFFGDISAHPDADKITDFIKELGYTALSLNGPLTDIGGAVILPQDGE